METATIERIWDVPGGILAILLGVLLLMVACSDGAHEDVLAPTPGSISPLSQGSSGPCNSLPPVAGVSERFSSIKFPPPAVWLEPPTVPATGHRADLYVPWSVERSQNFYLGWIEKAGHNLVWTDYEGFEAEVFFSLKTGPVVLVSVLESCDEGSLMIVRLLR